MSTMSGSLNAGALAGFAPEGAMAKALLDMLSQAGRAIDIDPGQAKAFIDRAARLLAPVSVATPVERPASGLAPWQARKVARHIDEYFAQPISNRELADLAGLSVSHFSRSFKISFGVAPRDYVIRQRLERAKTLMTETREPLSQIALDSGFCDQAHMCRTFQQMTGSTPSRWRRDHTLGLAA